MPSLADAAVQVISTGAPVLFLDTCSLLDVIRAPARGLTDCVEVASELLAMAVGPPVQFSLVVGSFVPGEWHDHERKVLELLTKHLQGMQEQAAHFHDLCAHFGLTLPFGLPQYLASGLAARLHDTSRRLLQAALVLDRHPDTVARAFDRVALTKRRPCRKGNQLEDCTIFEEYLQVCRHLRAGGFAGRAVFCTSNTEDYCAPGFTPHPEIAADCAAVGLSFTSTLPWALSELKRMP